MSQTKHYLDTSVVHGILFGTTKYKKYFRENFSKDSSYISPYIKMEIFRSSIIHIIEFYFVLNMPSINSIADATKLWSQRFNIRGQKVALVLISEILQNHKLDLNSIRDKRQALGIIRSYVNRLVVKLRANFKDTGVDSTGCPRPNIKLNSRSAEGLKEFQIAFNDEKECRTNCHIDRFFDPKHKAHTERSIQEADSLSSSAENNGFKDISKQLLDLRNKGFDRCTCKICAKIGDAVIAWDAQRNMTLEHVDHSFDHLCEIVDQTHRKHPPLSSFYK